jgi:Mrp family chromosome partitioning ATPase
MTSTLAASPSEMARNGASAGAPARQVAPVVAFANQKGGVGKTTSTVNAAVSLARRGYRTLLIDTDPQGNATSSLGIDKLAVGASIYDVLVDELPVADAVMSSARPNLDLVASTPMLAGAEIELVEAPNRETRLRAALSSSSLTVRPHWDCSRSMHLPLRVPSSCPSSASSLRSKGLGSS